MTPLSGSMNCWLLRVRSKHSILCAGPKSADNCMGMAAKAAIPSKIAIFPNRFFRTVLTTIAVHLNISGMAGVFQTAVSGRSVRLGT